MDERRRDRRVDAARQGADDQAVGAGLRAACASTRSRISATVDSMKLAGVQVGAAPAMPMTKLRRTSRPRGVWTTSGWNWIPYRLRSGSARPANGVESVWAVGAEALGQPGDRVAVAHPDRLLAVEAGEEAVVAR